MKHLTAQFPEIFDFLFEPARYKVAFGGRGGAKSWSYARALIMIASLRRVRILCAREIQKSIVGSVHKLLKDQIEKMGVSREFRVLETEIRGLRNGSEFLFSGLSDQTKDSLKSMESVDIVWCFPSGTPIDGQPIESVQAGDYVNSFNHTTGHVERRRVLKTFRSKAPDVLYDLLTEDGAHGITATPEHPVYVHGRGYTPIQNIKGGDIIYASETKYTGILGMLGRLWRTDSYRNEQGQARIIQAQRRDLLPGVCEEASISAYDQKQSNVGTGDTAKGERYLEGVPTSPACVGRQREGLFQAATESIFNAWAWMVARAYLPDRANIQPPVCDQLQGGFGQRLLSACNRDRWGQASRSGIYGSRREKATILTKHRVDSVKVHQQTGFGRSLLSDGGNYVYNIEVEGNNNYFANKILVHNCEESHSITKRSWDVLIPTIRKPGSEIWISFNPELETDETYQRFVVHPPPGTIAVKVNYTDNPYFGAESEADRAHCEKTQPDDYANIWLGECRPAVEGAIYYKDIQKAENENRITMVPYDPLLKVHVVADLGFNDALSIGLVQTHMSSIRIIRHLEFTHTRLNDVSAELQALRLNWGKVWLPHDGFAKGLNSGGHSTFDILTKLGWDCARREEVTQLPVEDGIRVARLKFAQCYFDKGFTAADGTPGAAKEGHTPLSGRLVECLKRYRRRVGRETGEAGAPLHDENSHGADLLRYICVNADNMRNDDGSLPSIHHQGYQKRDSIIGI